VIYWLVGRLMTQMSGVRNLLSDDPLLDVHARNVDHNVELHHLVCFVYMRALGTLPALVRQWWTSLDRRASDTVRSSNR